MKNAFFIIASLLTILTVQAQRTAVEDILAFDDFNRTEIGENYDFVNKGERISIAIDSARLKFSYTDSVDTRCMALADLKTNNYKFGGAATDSIVFTCSMRHNYGNANVELSGFDNGKRGLATILAATEDVSSTKGSGYAIVLGNILDSPAANGSIFRLVRFENGLNSNNKFTILVNGKLDSDGKNFFTLRVVYIPISNTWRFYQYKGGTREATAPDNIAANAWTYNGQAVDTTLANTVLNRYGFMYKVANSNSFKFNGYFDNFSVVAYPTVKKTSIYYDNFNRGSLVTDNYPYTVDSADMVGIFTNKDSGMKALRIIAPGNKSGVSTNGRQGVYGEYGNIGSLHSQDADSLVWMFNIRNSYSKTEALGGFGAGYRGIGVVLAADKKIIKDNSKGYAVIYGGNSKQQFRLAKFSNGVNGEKRFMEIIAGTAFSNQGTDYFSIRVVYVPKTDTWRLYDYTNGTEAFLDPASVTKWNFCGEAVDNTHTGATLDKFFFFQNFTGTAPFNILIDNYSLDSYHTVVTLSDKTNPMPVLNRYNGSTVMLNLSRPLAQGVYNTICLPFSLDAVKRKQAWGNDCTIYQLTSATTEGNSLNLIFSELTDADVMQAGTPYLIESSNTTDNITLEYVTIDTQMHPVTKSSVRFEGVLPPTVLYKNDNNTLFLGAHNLLYRSSQDAEMKGVRAIVKLSNSAVAPRIVIRDKADESTPTDAIREHEGIVSKKILRDGHLYIVRDGKAVNVLGY